MIRSFLFCALLLTSSVMSAQTRHLFIEPNVSFTYDSTAFRIGERFSNTAYRTESYEITYDGDPGRALINIGALETAQRTTQVEQDSMVALALVEGNKLDNGIVASHRPGIAVHYKGFTGLGVIVRAKQSISYGISFMCAAPFEGGACNLTYSRESTEPIDAYDADFRILEQVIDGIRLHPAGEFAERDSAMVPKVTVNVKQIERPADIPSFIKATWFGAVTVTGAHGLRVKQASVPFDRFTDDAQLFEPNSAGELIIYSYDATKGSVEKGCELIMLDELDREVRVAFRVSYENP